MALRRTPLARKTPLRATSSLSRGRRETPLERPPAPPLDFDQAARAMRRRAESEAAPRREHKPVPAPVPATKRPANTGFPSVVRQTILDRDGMACARCGVPVDVVGFNLQHRDNRGSGGTRDPRLNRAANGLTLCGSGTTRCHGWVEGHPEEAERLGYAVQSWADPESVPVYYAGQGWMLLSDNGCRRPCPVPTDGNAHAAARRKEPLK